MEPDDSEEGFEITGCSKRLNPVHNMSNFKYSYDQDELGSSVTLRPRDANSHLSECLVPNATALLGSPNIGVIIQDKALDNE